MFRTNKKKSCISLFSERLPKDLFNSIYWIITIFDESKIGNTLCHHLFGYLVKVDQKSMHTKVTMCVYK